MREILLTPKDMTTLKQLSDFLMNNPTAVPAPQFRGILEGNNIPYREGWETGEEQEYIFELIGEPDTWFIFESEEGEFLAIAEFETV
jgi:hypothetical protein